MEINYPLIRGEVVKCYNALLTDVCLEGGKIVPAFCGFSELKNFCIPGTEVYLKHHKSPRVVEYEIEFVVQNNSLISVNPSYGKELFKEAFKKRVITELKDFKICRDFGEDDALAGSCFVLLGKNNRKCVVFIEEIYTNINNYSVFPVEGDSFKIKTFENLARLRKHGYQTVIMMIVPRSDTMEAKFSWSQNPVTAAKIFDEAKNGLEFICYGCNVDKKSISISRQMNILY